MSDNFILNSIKAIQDLAGKIFFPCLISSVLVELGPWWQELNGNNLLSSYFVSVFVSVILSALFFALLGYVTTIFKEKNIFAPLIATTIMPLGFAGLFPEYFGNFDIPYTEVTGFAILAWSFMLLNGENWRKYKGHSI